MPCAGAGLEVGAEAKLGPDAGRPFLWGQLVMEVTEKQRLRESLRSLLTEVMLEVFQDREGMRAAITQAVKAAVVKHRSL